MVSPLSTSIRSEERYQKATNELIGLHGNLGRTAVAPRRSKKFDGCILHTTDPTGEPGIMEHAFCGGCLPCIDMSDDTNIPGVLDGLIRFVR